MRPVCLVILLAARAAIAQPAARQFASQTCHIAFSYRADWEVSADTTDPGDTCGFTLRPRDWRRRLSASKGVDLLTVRIHVFSRDVWQQAPESGFERRAGGWVVLGRMDASSPTDSIVGSGWRGLRGMALMGCYREGDGYAGTCDTPMAILGTSTRSVSLVAGPQSEDVFDRVIATLRLDP